VINSGTAQQNQLGRGELFLQRPNAGGLGDTCEYPKRDERKGHNVAANHPFLVLMDQAATNGDERQPCRHNPGNRQSGEAGAEDPAKVGVGGQIERSR